MKTYFSQHLNHNWPLGVVSKCRLPMTGAAISSIHKGDKNGH